MSDWPNAKTLWLYRHTFRFVDSSFNSTYKFLWCLCLISEAKDRWFDWLIDWLNWLIDWLTDWFDLVDVSLHVAAAEYYTKKLVIPRFVFVLPQVHRLWRMKVFRSVETSVYPGSSCTSIRTVVVRTWWTWWQHVTGNAKSHAKISSQTDLLLRSILKFSLNSYYRKIDVIEKHIKSTFGLIFQIYNGI